MVKVKVMEQTQRRFSRVALQFPARIAMDDWSSFDVEELTNLSIGGCLISMVEEVPLGTHMLVTIPLSEVEEGPKIEVGGEVVRCDDGYVAVKFIQIGPDSLFHLQNLIRYNAPDPDAIEEEIDEHPGLL